jgi:hypothetical protein
MAPKKSESQASQASPAPTKGSATSKRTPKPTERAQQSQQQAEDVDDHELEAGDESESEEKGATKKTMLRWTDDRKAALLREVIVCKIIIRNASLMFI